MRERPEMEARLLARQIPPDARVVGLIFAAAQEERAARAAEAVAAGLARRREHTLLAGCESSPSALDRLLGGSDTPGLRAAIRGEARLTDVAVRPEERLYVYLPVGNAFGPLEPDERFAAFTDRCRERGGTLLLFAPETLFALPAFRSLLDGYIALGRLEDAALAAGGPAELARLDFGEAAPNAATAPEPEATAEAEAVREPGAASEPEAAPEAGAVSEPEAAPEAGAVSEPEAAPEAEAVSEPEAAPEAGAGPDDAAPSLPIHAAPELDLDPEGEAAPQPDADPEVEAAPPADADPDVDQAPEVGPEGEEAPLEREGTADASPPGPVASGEEAAPAGSERRPHELPGAWRQHRERPRFPVLHVAIGVLILGILAAGWWAFAREAASPRPFGVDPVADGAPPISPEALHAAAEEAPEVPFSVLIASYAAADDARARLTRLRRAEDGLFFVAPTPVRGAVYHRVFAGARAGQESGSLLMEELVRSGRKEEASDWHVRPARLAFRLGVHASESEAWAEAERLEGAGVPAYVLPAGPVEWGYRAWQVYAGAYESEAAAGPMAALLERAELHAELVVRRGEAR